MVSGRGNLVPKRIVDKNGRKTTVYVRPNDLPLRNPRMLNAYKEAYPEGEPSGTEGVEVSFKEKIAAQHAKMERRRLQGLKDTDPLGVAEEITGKSYKEDEETVWAGMGMMQTLSKMKAEEFGRAGDTYFNMPFQESLATFERHGFEPVYAEDFEGGEGRTESYVVLWNPEKGWLGTVESYRGEGTNMSKIYFNAKRVEGKAFPNGTSGHFNVKDLPDGSEEWVWIGDVDAREGVFTTLAGFEDEGYEFLPSWVESPNLYMYTYKDSSSNEDRDANGNYNFDWMHRRTDEIVGRLPDEVKQSICVDDN